MDPETFQAINRAVTKAVDMINADKRKFLHYMIDDPQYTDEIVEDRYHWMNGWGLTSAAACAADLVDNRLPQTAAANH